MNANLESLKKIHGKDGAEGVLREIADLGGFGVIGVAEGSIHPAYAGGLDVRGVLDPSNTAVSEKAKERIAELSGVDRKAVDKAVETGAGASSNHKMQGKEK